MAMIGLSKPYIATYSASGSTVTYTARSLLGKYTNLEISLDNADESVFYADNGPAENDDTLFTSGTATITTDDLRPDAMKLALGLKEESITGSGSGSTGNKWLVFDDDQAAPYFALGGIIKKKVDGAVKWCAFVLEKIKFRNPGMSLATQGETIEWQTPELEANIYRSDKTKHPWYRISTLLDSEASAVSVLEGYLTVASSGGGGSP